MKGSGVTNGKGDISQQTGKRKLSVKLSQAQLQPSG